ncbi:Gfo/Idh/MocA family protein [Actinomadura sp. HBU206391]|uniref:Gfo/Idh/MocA family protein n=1 Tax=Actinomadura sp. HBU206391 TaxID=2731692 RepID=UPI00164FBF08|nr:Gfo/Idh/MocA family oxidoreductase [Actinomadura sp. HBU206391]MBC6458221.1 Gfo/Idh/MocA family oxidoreductase [Actinomadura sp. HBU206391]
MTATSVVLAGAHGHGRMHLRNLRRLADSGLVRLAGVCDLIPVGDDAFDGLGRPEQSSDLPGLLRDTGAEIAILATPIHTHTELTLAALAEGSHVLLEKPPAATYTDYERIVAGADGSGRVCQVGFQSLGSRALPAVRELIDEGAIGRVRGIGAAGSWSRDSAYYDRARWAGQRRVDGADVVDGALTNPFAHALATALSVDGSEGPQAVGDIELELFHAFPIESDDTSCLRLRTAKGTVITVAVTLCAPRRSEPYVVVHGDAGRITLCYTRDEVRLERADGTVTVDTHPRVDLLENLIAHVRGDADLLVPLRRTGGFMRVLEAVRTAPDPRPIPEDAQDITEEDGVVGHVVHGIEELVEASAEWLALYSELGVRWAGQKEVR